MGRAGRRRGGAVRVCEVVSQCGAVATSARHSASRRGRRPHLLPLCDLSLSSATWRVRRRLRRRRRPRRHADLWRRHGLRPSAPPPASPAPPPPSTGLDFSRRRSRRGLDDRPRHVRHAAEVERDVRRQEVYRQAPSQAAAGECRKPLVERWRRGHVRLAVVPAAGGALAVQGPARVVRQARREARREGVRRVGQGGAHVRPQLRRVPEAVPDASQLM